jgi:CO/xanthine dehydrogenase Mo-binding subunit
MEEILHNPQGGMINASFSTYIIPTIKDAPETKAIIVEEEFPEGPFGAKGFGEQPLMGVAPAVAGAIAHAAGIQPDQIPAKPERIVEWIKQKQNK